MTRTEFVLPRVLAGTELKAADDAAFSTQEMSDLAFAHHEAGHAIVALAQQGWSNGDANINAQGGMVFVGSPHAHLLMEHGSDSPTMRYHSLCKTPSTDRQRVTGP